MRDLFDLLLLLMSCLHQAIQRKTRKSISDPLEEDWWVNQCYYVFGLDYIDGDADKVPCQQYDQ